MKKCKDIFPRKVFCSDCKHKKDESFDCPWSDDICKVNYVWEYNYKRCWKRHIECEILNKNNDCPDFEPKENIFKRLFRIFSR